MIKLLVFGGRDYKDWQRVYAALDIHLDQHGADGILIIHGACRTGADRFADQWAAQNEVDCIRVPARWKATAIRRMAGPMRNWRMGSVYRPHQALQFPGGNGTANMRDVCDKLGIPVAEYA